MHTDREETTEGGCVIVCGGGGREKEREIEGKCYSRDRKEWTSVAKEAKALRGTQNPESNKCCT
jgi:hypothetical protein